MLTKMMMAVASLAKVFIGHVFCIRPPTLGDEWSLRELPWEDYSHSDRGCRQEFFRFTDSEFVGVTRLQLIESVNVTAAILNRDIVGLTGFRYARPKYPVTEAAFVECMDTKVQLSPGEVRLTGRPYYLMYCWKNRVLIIASEKSQYPLEETHNKAACVPKDSIFPRDVRSKESTCVEAKLPRSAKQVTAWLTRGGKAETSYIVLSQKSRTKQKYDSMELAEMVNLGIKVESDYALIYQACAYNSYGSDITLHIGTTTR